MILLQTSDFTGYYSIQINTPAVAVRLQDYIDRYEKHYLVQILGLELANLFIADLANPSQDVRFSVIQDELYYTYNDCDYHSFGLVPVLSALIYWHFITDEQVQRTASGIGFPNIETRVSATPVQAAREGEKKWNEALDSISAIQIYCYNYADVEYADQPDRQYPEYNGRMFKPKWNVLL